MTAERPSQREAVGAACGNSVIFIIWTRGYGDNEDDDVDDEMMLMMI